MSQPKQMQIRLYRELKPETTSNEPDLWFQELRLLRRLSVENRAQIRRIDLKPGLNSRS
jgi:hypothetical protein